MSKAIKKCPCQSGEDYQVCCRRYHLGKIHAPTAEALMRSRYSAYVLKLPQYIYKTWHPETRLSLQELRDNTNQDFVKLEIIDIELGLEENASGAVTFIASFLEEGQEKQYQEKSEFRRENKRWVYWGLR